MIIIWLRKARGVGGGGGGGGDGGQCPMAILRNAYVACFYHIYFSM